MDKGLRTSTGCLPLDVAVPGGTSTRGFWTKRRRTATSLVAIMALVAGIAVAYKLFEQEVPNNTVRDASNFDYTIMAQDLAAGETTFRNAGITGGTGDKAVTFESGVFRQSTYCAPAAPSCTPDDVNIFPGDSRTSKVLISNENEAPDRDASFSVYASLIRVYSYCANGTNPVTGAACTVGDYAEQTGLPMGNQFLGFFRLDVTKQTYTTNVLGLCDTDDCTENTSESSYETACAAAALNTFTRLSPCKLGMIRADGTMTGSPFDPPLATNTASDDREYRFTLAELDSGDQTKFMGWRVTFTLNFSARVPAEDEGSSRYSGQLHPLPA